MIEKVGVLPHSFELGKDTVIESIPLDPFDIHSYALFVVLAG